MVFISSALLEHKTSNITHLLHLESTLPNQILHYWKISIKFPKCPLQEGIDKNVQTFKFLPNSMFSKFSHGIIKRGGIFQMMTFTKKLEQRRKNSFLRRIIQSNKGASTRMKIPNSCFKVLFTIPHCPILKVNNLKIW